MTRHGLDAWSMEARRAAVLESVPSCWGTDGEEWFARNTAQLRTCIRICARCPLRASCLAGALARDEQFGVWGGLRFKPAWVQARVVLWSDGYGLVGRNSDGSELHRQLPGFDGERARRLALKLRARGRRRAFVARWVRRVGTPMPGGWWVGPWTEADPEVRVALMRRVVPSMLRDWPVERWPWELRMLAEFPASAVPRPIKRGRPVPKTDHEPVPDEGDDRGRLNPVPGDFNPERGDHGRSEVIGRVA